MEHVVGIGGFAVSNDPNDIIKTFALSTCVGLVYYSMRKRCMGMAHIQLPNSRAMRAEDKPSRFADMAPEHLLKLMMQKYGCTKGEILISLYGGIAGRGAGDCFCIGDKNIDTVKSTLKRLGLVYSDVDTGGADSRTLVAFVNSGIVEVIKRPMIGSGGVRPMGAKPAPSAGTTVRYGATGAGVKNR